MRWEDFRQSDNVEDYRGQSGGESGGGGLPIPGFDLGNSPAEFTPSLVASLRLRFSASRTAARGR